MLNRYIISTLIAGALCVPAIEAGVAGRQKHQAGRIRQGAASGELTRRETARLGKAWGNLHQTIVRDRADGGGLTGRERVKIDARQDRLSRGIYRQKHDAQVRPR